MGTSSIDHAGPRPFVDVFPDGRLREPALRGSEERLTTVLVTHGWPALLEIVIDNLRSSASNADGPFSLSTVLERSVGVRSVVQLQVRVIAFRVIISNVETVSSAHPHPRLDEDEPGHVLRGGVLILGQIVENLVRSLRVEGGLADVPAVGDERRLDLLEQPRLHGVDRLAPS